MPGIRRRIKENKMELIRLENICKSYGYGSFIGKQKKLEVLKNINLTINKGECAGLIGMRGCGKSTLGRIVLNIEKYDSGKIFFCGKELKYMNRTEYSGYRKNVQVVFQNGLTSFNPKWKVEHILREPIVNFLKLQGSEINNKISELLDMVGMRDSDMEKYPHQFSGGQLQRINIARSLATKPSLIVLDEAVSSLDMIIQSSIIDLLKDLKKKNNTSYLFICHDMRLVNSICDTIHFIHDGKLSETVKAKDDIAREYHPEYLKFVDRKHYNSI
jgi:nickel transport system ATP-binding protein